MSPIGSNVLAGASGQGGAASEYKISKGLRFNSADSSAFSRAVRTAGNRKTWTWSGWVKRSTSSASAKNVLFEAAGNGFMFGFDDGTADVLRIEDNFYTGGLAAKTTAVFRDFSAWYHIVLAIDTTQASSSDGIKVWVNNVLQTLTSVTYTQNHETVINDATTQYIGGNLTWSGRYFNGYIADVYFIDGTALEPSVFGEYDTNGIWQPKETTGDTISAAKESEQPYNTRDNMAVEWTSSGSNSNFASSGTYQFSHLFNGVVVDQQAPGTAGLMTAPSANSAATWTYTISDAHTFQVRIYVPNSSFVAAGNVKVNGNDITQEHVINAGLSNDNWHTLTVTGLSGFTSFEVNSYYWYISTIWINGRQLVDGPADNSKIWSANLTSSTGSFWSGQGAGNAFNGEIGSGQETNPSVSSGTLTFTPTGGIAYTQSIEVAVAALGNRSVVINGGSPTIVSTVDQYVTVATGSGTLNSLSVDGTASANWPALAAIRIDGKVLVDSPSQWNASQTWSSGVTTGTLFGTSTWKGLFDGVVQFTSNADVAYATTTCSLTFPAPISGDIKVIATQGGSVANDIGQNKIRLSDGTEVTVDNISSNPMYFDFGTKSNITSVTLVGAGNSSGVALWAIYVDGKVLVDGGWGRNGFHLPFNDSTDIGKDVSVTEELDPRGGFSAVLYTGNGAWQSINALQFQPDFVWIKRRNSNSDHQLYDSVRGAPLGLSSDLAAAEWNYASGLQSFLSDGFTLGSLGGANGSSDTHVAWCWKAGGPAVSNSDGTITSTVSADPNYGFSIVSYSGSSANATVGHGLNSAPKVIFLARRDGTTGFYVYHSSVGATKTGYLYGTSIFETYAAAYNDTAPTSSVFSVGTAAATNSGNMIAYCWSEVSGYSKFGSYASTGSANHLITTGFKPAWVLIKCTNTAGQEWVIFDAPRNPTNPANLYLYANYGYSEASYGNRAINILDNGFSLPGSDPAVNNSGDTYVYMAFADAESNPFTPHNLITEESTASKDNFAATTYVGNGHNLSVGGQRFSTLSSVTGGTLTNAINAFNGSGSNWATLTATNTSTAAAVDFNFKTPITGVTKVEMAFDSPSGSGDTRGRVNGANSGATRTGTGSGYSDVYTGSAITLTSVGWAINQNSATGTSSDIVSRIRITDSIGTYFLIDGEGTIGFQPDLVWYKHTTAASSHGLFDSVRGTTNYLSSNSTSAESTVSGVTSFNSDGFSLGSDSGSNGVGTWVAWCWKAGGAASSNSNGTITSQVSANPNFGFSIVTYTGSGSTATVGHGLSAEPKFIIVKDRSASDSWMVWFTGFTSDQYLYLNGTDAKGTYSGTWGSTPTSSVFGVSDQSLNQSGNNFVAYCWSEVPGYSRFSSYVGNGSSGNKVTLGFKPRWVMIKCTSTAAQEWCIFDTARNRGNPADLFIYANYSNAEGSYSNRKINVLSDGFEFYGSDAAVNNSGDTYIYAAFADSTNIDLDLLNDTPTANTEDPVKGNFATLNPLATTSNQTLSNGNLKCAANGNQWGCSPSTIGMTSGKWYFEATITLTQYTYVGIANAASTIFNTAAASNPYVGMTSNDWGYLSSSGDLVNNTSTLTSGASLSTGDTLGVAFDVDTKEAKWYKNGTLEVTRTLTGDAPWFFGVGSYASGAFSEVNFGQYTFRHTPPTGYKALCTTNLPDSTITDGSKYFKPILRSGGGTTQTPGFSPDLVWEKRRDSSSSHYLFDKVRGDDHYISSDSNAAEGSGYSNWFTFDSNGYTVGASNDWPASASVVDWAWDGGTSNTSISAGSLNSSTYNTSAVWSNALTASTLKTATAGFNGDISSGRSEGVGGLTFTPSGGISVSSIVEVYDNNSVTKSRVTVNNVQQSDVQHVASNWVTVFTGSGTLNSLYSVRTDMASYDAGFYAIRVDGKILVDSNITPANVPALASTVRANPSAGFSIVSWTGNRTAGATVGHGLNAVPELVIVKNRDQAANWMTYHKSSGAGGYLALNLTNAFGAASSVWNSTAPDSSVFTLGADSESNGNGDNMITYCFASVEGYSSIGSYTGNGSSDGPFIYTGFRPAFLLIKNTGATEYWILIDSARSPDNVAEQFLYPNDSIAEGTQYFDTDLLSNGFKLKNSVAGINSSAGNYIYVAFAENPFKITRAR